MLKVPRRWENRPRGPLPDFVHDFYNHPGRRTPQSTRRVVSELLHRNRDLIQAHVARFLAERKAKVDAYGAERPVSFAEFATISANRPLSFSGLAVEPAPVPDRALLAAAITGATKAILLSQNAYEVQQRFTTTIHGAMANEMNRREMRVGGAVRESHAASRIQRAFENLVWPQSLQRLGDLTRQDVLSELYSPRTPRGPKRKVLRALFHLPKPMKPYRDVVFSDEELSRYVHPEAVRQILTQPGLDLRSAENAYEQPTVKSVAEEMGVSKQNVSSLAKKGLVGIAKTVQDRKDRADIRRFFDPSVPYDKKHPGVAAFLRYHADTLSDFLKQWKHQNSNSNPLRVANLEKLESDSVASALAFAATEALFEAKERSKPLGAATGLMLQKVTATLNRLAGVKRGPQPRVVSLVSRNPWSAAITVRIDRLQRQRRVARALQLAFYGKELPLGTIQKLRKPAWRRRQQKPAVQIQGQGLLFG